MTKSEKDHTKFRIERIAQNATGNIPDESQSIGDRMSEWIHKHPTKLKLKRCQDVIGAARAMFGEGWRHNMGLGLEEVFVTPAEIRKAKKSDDAALDERRERAARINRFSQRLIDDLYFGEITSGRDAIKRMEEFVSSVDD